MRASLAETIGSEACAHILADGECLRVSGGIEDLNFALDKYPQSHMPEHHAILRFDGYRPTARQLAAALRRMGYRKIIARYDD
jgi:hypothetical protein